MRCDDAGGDFLFAALACFLDSIGRNLCRNQRLGDPLLHPVFSDIFITVAPRLPSNCSWYNLVRLDRVDELFVIQILSGNCRV